VQDDDVEKEKGHDVEDDDVEGDDEKDDNVPEDEVEEDNAAEDEVEDDDVEDDDVKGDAPQNLGAHFVRACAVETHVKISQEPLYAEIYRKTPGPRVSTLIKHRPLHLP